MGVFDVAQHVVSEAAGLINKTTELGMKMDNIEDMLRVMEIGELVGLYAQVFLVSLTVKAASIVIFVVIWGRMMEVYLLISIGPVPLSTMGNREWSGVGQNYLKSLAAIGMQGFFILVCVAIYAVMVEAIQSSADISSAILQCCGYTILLCFTLMKTGSFSKAVFHAH